MQAVEIGSSVGSSYVDALEYPVSSCVTEPSWRRGVRDGVGQPASASPAHGKMPRGASEQHSGRSCVCSFPQRDHCARKGVLRVIADDETSGLLAPHASTGMSRSLHSRSAALVKGYQMPAGHLAV